jgi:hypothetical protein
VGHAGDDDGHDHDVPELGRHARSFVKWKDTNKSN